MLEIHGWMFKVVVVVLQWPFQVESSFIYCQCYFVVCMCLRFWSWTPRFDSICSFCLPFLIVYDVIDYIEATHLIYVPEDL